MAKEGRGQVPPIFCQDVPRDYFKTDEKINEGGSSKSSDKQVSFMLPTFIALQAHG